MNKRTIVIAGIVLVMGGSALVLYGYLKKERSIPMATTISATSSVADISLNDDSWVGEWIGSRSPWITGNLKITQVTKKGFAFTFDANAGAGTGTIPDAEEFASAIFIDKNNAVFESKIEDVYQKPSDIIENDDNGICRIHFEKRGDKIKTTQTNSCASFAGMGVTFEFENLQKNGIVPSSSISDLEVLKTKEQQDAFSMLVGKSLSVFTDTAMMDGTLDDLDELHVDIETYGVEHLGNSVGSIIMVRGTNIWAAVIDPGNSDVITYFTNVREWKNKVPKTIETWAGDIGRSIVIGVQ